MRARTPHTHSLCYGSVILLLNVRLKSNREQQLKKSKQKTGHVLLWMWREVQLLPERGKKVWCEVRWGDVMLLQLQLNTPPTNVRSIAGRMRSMSLQLLYQVLPDQSEERRRRQDASLVLPVCQEVMHIYIRFCWCFLISSMSSVCAKRIGEKHRPTFDRRNVSRRRQPTSSNLSNRMPTKSHPPQLRKPPRRQRQDRDQRYRPTRTRRWAIVWRSSTRKRWKVKLERLLEPFLFEESVSTTSTTHSEARADRRGNRSKTAPT